MRLGKAKVTAGEWQSGDSNPRLSEANSPLLGAKRPLPPPAAWLPGAGGRVGVHLEVMPVVRVRVHQGPELHQIPPHLLIPLPGGGEERSVWGGWEGQGLGSQGDQGAQMPMPAWPGYPCPGFTMGALWSSERGNDLAEVTQQIKWQGLDETARSTRIPSGCCPRARMQAGAPRGCKDHKGQGLGGQDIPTRRRGECEHPSSRGPTLGLRASGPGSLAPPLRHGLSRPQPQGSGASCPPWAVPGQVAPGPALQQGDLAAQRAEAAADEEAAEAALQREGGQVHDALPHALQQLVQVLLEEQLRRAGRPAVRRRAGGPSAGTWGEQRWGSRPVNRPSKGPETGLACH